MVGAPSDGLSFAQKFARSLALLLSRGGKKGSIEAHGGRKKIERGSVRAPMGEGESSAGQPKKKSFASLTGSLRFQQAGRQRLAGLASEPCYESPSSRHALRKRKKCRSRSWASIAACCTKRGELRDREVENCRLARSDSNFVWNAPSDVRPRSATTDHRKKKTLQQLATRAHLAEAKLSSRGR